MLYGMLTKDTSNPVQFNLSAEIRSTFNKAKWRFLLDAPFDVSDKCCNVMKKSPAHTYNHRTGSRPITAQMASESTLRTMQWLKSGCNAFDANEPISNPMSFWTEQDVLWYIKIYQLQICSVYGDIAINEDGNDKDVSNCDVLNGSVLDHERPLLHTTMCQRTGCMFCMFGAHLERGEGRLERLKRTHPKQYEYIMKPKEEGGLNFKEIIDWVNKHGNLNIRY